jgi:hypothetical protein
VELLYAVPAFYFREMKKCLPDEVEGFEREDFRAKTIASNTLFQWVSKSLVNGGTGPMGIHIERDKSE